MTAAHILAMLTADPSDIAYACGARNMTVTTTSVSPQCRNLPPQLTNVVVGDGSDRQ